MPFSAASGAVALSNLAMYVTILALPVLLEREGGWSSGAIGLLLASLSAAAVLLTPIGGRLADSLGRRAPAVAGLSLQAVAIVPLALAAGDLPAAALVASLVAAGAGIGLASPSLQVSAVESVDVRSAGVASGVFSTSRYAGSIAGTALLAGPLAPAAAGSDGFGLLFAVLVAAAAGSALLALLLSGRALPEPGAASAPSRPLPAAAGAAAR